jgi:hypothetical protein
MSAGRTKVASKGPEKKIGPLPGCGGIGVAVWLNEVETDDGPRHMRSAYETERFWV